MNITREKVVTTLIKDKRVLKLDTASAFASTNIALCKYWGKRDVELNLPMTSSLSVSLGELGASTKISLSDSEEVWLNGEAVATNTLFYQRLIEFFDLFRPTADTKFKIETDTNIPIAAGLASSACGFAATVKALDKLFAWEQSDTHLSILARLGSGSACRSIYDGFVLWNAGIAKDGMDSYAEDLEYIWPELRVGILLVDSKQKSISSRDAMQATVETCPYYKLWPETVNKAIKVTDEALEQRDFWALGTTAEANSLAMHALMLATTPPIIYSQGGTLELMQKVWRLRAEGLPVFFTQDAGPNLKLLFQEKDEAKLKEQFAEMRVVAPFAKVKESTNV